MRWIAMAGLGVLVASILVNLPRDESLARRVLVLVLTGVATLICLRWLVLGRAAGRAAWLILLTLAVAGGIVGALVGGATSVFSFLAALNAGRLQAPATA